ncbi:uncharacterized protein PV06_11300 [Exophiala oligosperma]|uniref:Uncharacterized protein n=1 Tax=Exophiala oligosperma TaxID=215243 RepID=A0A0D2D2I9_9EURO|nr:uncharacterized protein PV06_11300 [Exophiala oligosperma]KIW36445.1 hypothetical protein PV06_11300 [Exophiala oligosperma]
MSTQVLMDVKLFFGTQNSQNQVSWTQYGTGFRISVANEMYTKHAFMSQLIGCMKSRYSAHSEMEKFSNLTFELSARESDIDNETIFDVTWLGETHPECVLRHYGFQANNPTSDGLWDGELGPHVWQIAVFAHESSESSPWGLKSHLQPGKAIQSFTIKRSSKRRNDRLAQRLYRILRANTRMFKAPTEAFGQYSLLGFSESHLGWENGGKTAAIARHYQALAYSGLQGIEVVSSENSEVVLAATTLLLWQAPNRLSWQQLRKGLSNVREVMKPWAHESPLAHHHGVAGLVRTPQPALVSEYRVRLLRVLSELRSRFEESGPSDESLRIRSIRDMESSLQSIEQNFQDHQPLLEIRTLDLSALSQGLSRLSNAHHEFFGQIHVVRSLVLWLPPSIVDTETIEPLDLVLLVLVYAGR